MLLAASFPAFAEPGVIYATSSGLPAYDQDPFGGNPFASALIATLAEEQRDRPINSIARIEALTIGNSGGEQFPDTRYAEHTRGLAPLPGERAVALVAVFADYGDDAGLASLPGAAFDADRVSKALSAAGYEVTVVIAATGQEYLTSLENFSAQAKLAERSLMYTTGHGFEVDKSIFIIPPEAEENEAILEASIPLADIRTTLASAPNTLLLYAGCRDNPLGLSLKKP
jgi:hypothetical protein